VANRLDQTPDRIGITPDWDTITLVNPEVQLPILEELYTTQYDVSESRFRLLSPAVVQALSDATTSVLEGTTSPADAASAVQAAAQG
jgi:hypothetical protein